MAQPLARAPRRWCNDQYRRPSRAARASKIKRGALPASMERAAERAAGT